MWKNWQIRSEPVNYLAFLISCIYIYLYLFIQHYALIKIHQPITPQLLASKANRSTETVDGSVKWRLRREKLTGQATPVYVIAEALSALIIQRRPKMTKRLNNLYTCAHITETKSQKMGAKISSGCWCYCCHIRGVMEQERRAYKTAFSTLCSSLSLCRLRRNGKKNEGFPQKWQHWPKKLKKK